MSLSDARLDKMTGNLSLEICVAIPHPKTGQPNGVFKAKYNLPFVLLSDDEKAAAQAFGVWKEKTMYGKKVMGIERSTFVIGPDGRIEKIYAKVKAAGHAAEVLQDL